jgi:TetR/AcrR family transcriptional regulator
LPTSNTGHRDASTLLVASRLRLAQHDKRLFCYNLTNQLINFMQAAPIKFRLGSRGRPEESRAAILLAAVREFSDNGIAGARVDAIARAAKVNKALVYYYFKDKEALYGAVLDHVFSGLTSCISEALSKNSPPRDRILAYAGAHFDYIAGHPLYPRIVQAELMRAGRGGATHLERIGKQYFRRIFSHVAEVLRQGMSAGDFRMVDEMHFITSMVAIITFYFNSAPVMRLMTGVDPISKDQVAKRRAAVLDFIAAALFEPRRNPKGVRS